MDFVPPVMHPLGRLTHYAKSKTKSLRYFDDKESYRKLKKYLGSHYSEYRRQEEEDKLFKQHLLASQRAQGDLVAEIDTMDQLNSQLQEEEYERVANNNAPQDTLESRSHHFYQIRYLLDRNSHYDNPQVLERVHRRLNVLAYNGIMDEKEYRAQVLIQGCSDTQVAQARKDQKALDDMQQ